MSDTAVANTATQLSGKTLVVAENDQNITGNQTFNRAPSAPFTVQVGSAKVTNLEADLLDGQEGTYYTNASNLATGTVPTARLGSGTASASTFLRGDQSYAKALMGTSYTASLTNVTNNTQTTFLSFTVPANDMSNGDVISIHFATLVKNNKGTAGSAEIDAFWGGASIRTTDGAGGFAWSNSATERNWMFVMVMQRVGADVWIFGPQSTSSISRDFINGVNPTLYSGAVVISAPTFSSDQTIALKMTLSATDATFYFKPQIAKVVRF